MNYKEYVVLQQETRECLHSANKSLYLSADCKSFPRLSNSSFIVAAFRVLVIADRNPELHHLVEIMNGMLHVRWDRTV